MFFQFFLKLPTDFGRRRGVSPSCEGTVGPITFFFFSVLRKTTCRAEILEEDHAVKIFRADELVLCINNIASGNAKLTRRGERRKMQKLRRHSAACNDDEGDPVTGSSLLPLTNHRFCSGSIKLAVTASKTKRRRGRQDSPMGLLSREIYPFSRVGDRFFFSFRSFRGL